MGHHSLLKTVLTKSASRKKSNTRFSSKTRAVYVLGLINQYCRVNHDFDIVQMDMFTSALTEYVGEASNAITVDLSDMDVRQHLEDAIPSLMQPLEIEGPATFSKINSINWRILFHIPPEIPIPIIVTPGSDDDSGAGSSNASTG